MRPDCILVCLPEEIADLRISNPRLSLREREALADEKGDAQFGLNAIANTALATRFAPHNLLAKLESATAGRTAVGRVSFRSCPLQRPDACFGRGMVRRGMETLSGSAVNGMALRFENGGQNWQRGEAPEFVLTDVLDKYDGLAGMLPSRVVIHKTSQYQPEEEAGFRKAAAARVPVADLIWLRSTAFRLIRKGTQEPWRGTLCTLGDESYLFTSGYIPWWDEYPGPHIPAPIQIGSCGSTDLRERAREILALSKMNWNSTEGQGRYPMTISFARKVGNLMTELSDNQTPNPSYRFYM